MLCEILYLQEPRKVSLFSQDLRTEKATAIQVG